MCGCACALYNACSRAVVSRFVLYSGSARDASGQAAFVHGRAPKSASLGSWDMYPFARKGRAIGLQCMTL